MATSKPRPAATVIVVRMSRSITHPLAARSLRLYVSGRKQPSTAPAGQNGRGRVCLVPARQRPHAETMDIALPPAEPTQHAVRRDRTRVGYAVLGAAGLVVGIWLAWLGA